MGLWDEYDDTVSVEGSVPNFKPGDYFCRVDAVKEHKALKTKQRYLKVYLTVLHVITDMGDSNVEGDEAGHAMFPSGYGYFERETKSYVKAAKNLDTPTANKLQKSQVKKFLVDEDKLVNRVLQIKAREVAPKESKESDDDSDDEDEKPKKKGKKEKKPIIRVTIQRSLTAEECLAEGISKKVLRKFCPDGVREPSNGKIPAPSARDEDEED